MRRRRRVRRWAQPDLFPAAEETLPLPEEAMRDAVRGLAELLLSSLELEQEQVKGGFGESEDHA
jgi:hypothetical protein